MATKTVCVHRYVMPPLGDFVKKYYFLISSLLFEYQSGGYYRDDVEVYGFNEREMQVITSCASNFYADGRMLKAEDFGIYMIKELINVLPKEWKSTLIDHMILSSIDKSEQIREAFNSLMEKMELTKDCLPFQQLKDKDFIDFFEGKDSSFMNEYYPTDEEKNEIRLQYGLKR